MMVCQHIFRPLEAKIIVILCEKKSYLCYEGNNRAAPSDRGQKNSILIQVAYVFPYLGGQKVYKIINIKIYYWKKAKISPR